MSIFNQGYPGMSFPRVSCVLLVTFVARAHVAAYSIGENGDNVVDMTAFVTTESGDPQDESSASPEPLDCAPPDCVMAANTSASVPKSSALQQPAPATGEEDGTQFGLRGDEAPQFDTTSANAPNAPGLVVEARAGDPGGPAAVAVRAPLSGTNNSGAPQFTNASDDTIAPLFAPPPPPPAETTPVTMSLSSKNGTTQYIGNVTEESINPEIVAIAASAHANMASSHQQTLPQQALAPGCAPGETPNTPHGCEHPSDEQVHYKSTSGKQKNVQLRESYGGDYTTEKKIAHSRAERATHKRHATKTEGKDTALTDLAQETKVVNKEENRAKAKVLAHEKGLKATKKASQAKASQDVVQQQLLKSRAQTVPVEAPSKAPLENAASELDAKKNTADANRAAAQDRAHVEELKKSKIDDDKYKDERSVAYPQDVDVTPPDPPPSEKDVYNYDDHTKEQNMQHSILLENKMHQAELEKQRVVGKIGVPGQGNVSETRTPAEHAVSERYVKLHQAQYDRDKGEPVTHKASAPVIMQHVPGADVVPRPGPQFDTSDTPTDEVHYESNSLIAKQTAPTTLALDDIDLWQ